MLELFNSFIIHSFIHSSVHHSFSVDSFNHLFIISFLPSFIHSFIHLTIHHSFIYSSIHSFMPLIHSFINNSFIHPFIDGLTIAITANSPPSRPVPAVSAGRRGGRAGWSAVRRRRPRRLGLPQHSGAMGHSDQTVELRGQPAASAQHVRRGSAQWKVSRRRGGGG